MTRWWCANVHPIQNPPDTFLSQSRLTFPTVCSYRVVLTNITHSNSNPEITKQVFSRVGLPFQITRNSFSYTIRTLDVCRIAKRAYHLPEPQFLYRQRRTLELCRIAKRVNHLPELYRPGRKVWHQWGRSKPSFSVRPALLGGSIDSPGVQSPLDASARYG
jgi:hypothetical protein